MMRRLLIISCSKRKVRFDSPHPAFDVYDGVTYRVLKKIQRDYTWPDDLDMLILSAEFGLISPDFFITYYDREMTNRRADELQEDVSSSLLEFIRINGYSEVVVNLGATYFKVFENTIWPNDLDVGLIAGRIGQKLQLMKQWVLSPAEAKHLIQWV